jgi:hypothetical protein
VYDPLAFAIMIASLAVAAWCFVPVARDRFLDRSHLVLLGAVEFLVLVMAIVAVVRLIGGDHPVELITFVGYLLTTVLVLPAAVGLALMEPTRWGSMIAASSALVVAVLTLRLLQVWTPLAP